MAFRHNIVSTDADVRFGAILQRPRPFRRGPSEVSPITCRCEAFGKVIGDWFSYNQRPRSGRFPSSGTGPGGVAFLPPELDMRYIVNDMMPTDGGTISPTYIVACQTHWAAGYPDLATGTIRNGYSWRALAGALLFSRHAMDATKTEAVRFTDGEQIAFRATTNYWGTLDHANTADRTWFFPDADGTVMLGASPLGLKPDRVVVTDISGLLVDNDAIRWDAATSTMDLGVASGSSIVVSGGTAVTGVLRFSNELSTFLTSIRSGVSTQDQDYTLPTAYPTASDCALACASGTGTLSWQRFALYGSGVLSITGTANQVIASAGTGDVTLSLPQSIHTTGTPQFARLGLGAAADGAIPLYVNSGIMGLGLSVDANMTNGLLINQPGINDEAIALADTTQINHGMTSRAIQTVYGFFKKSIAASGGLYIAGLSETNQYALLLVGHATGSSSTKTTAGTAPVMIAGYAKSGTTSGAVAADGNVVTFLNGTTALAHLDAEGQLHINETSTDTFPTIDLKQSSTGDVGIRVGCGANRSYMFGIDNDASTYSFKIATAASATAVLGTGDLWVLESDGHMIATVPCVRAYSSADTAVPTSTWTYIPLNSERYDNDTMHSNVTNSQRITFTHAGKYSIGGCAQLDANGSGTYRMIGIYVWCAAGNGFIAVASFPFTTWHDTHLAIHAEYEFAAGDYAALYVYQDSGGTISTTTNDKYAPEFWAARISG